MYGFLDFLIRVANICQKQGKGEFTLVHSLRGQKSITAGTVYGWRPHGSSPSHISPRQEDRVGYSLQGLLPEKHFLLKISQHPSQSLQLWAKLYSWDAQTTAASRSLLVKAHAWQPQWIFFPINLCTSEVTLSSPTKVKILSRKYNFPSLLIAPCIPQGTNRPVLKPTHSHHTP